MVCIVEKTQHANQRKKNTNHKDDKNSFASGGTVNEHTLKGLSFPPRFDRD